MDGPIYAGEFIDPEGNRVEIVPHPRGLMFRRHHAFRIDIGFADEVLWRSLRVGPEIGGH